MASSNSPPPSSMAIPPSSSPPPPSSTQPPIAQPNATSDPPTSSNSPPSTPNSPPPSLSTPNTPPPTINAPPPTPNSPPPTPNDPSPPPTSNDPPPPPPTPSPLPPTPILTPPPQSPPPTPVRTPPSTTSPPPPTPISTPPPQSPPTTPTLPPPTAPTKSPPTTPTLPPPTSPTKSPPTTPTLPPPTSPTKSPPTVSAPPPSPPLPTPPPPLSTTPAPVLSPPSPVSMSPPKSQDPPSNSSTPPPKEQPPNVPSTPPSNPDPLVPPPPVSSGSPLPSPTNPSDDPIVSNPSGNKSSTFGPNVTARSNVGGGGGGTKIAVPVAIIASLFVLSLIGLAVWYVRKKKRNGGYSTGFVMPSPLTSSQVSGSPYAQSPSAPLVYLRSGSQNLMNKSQPDPSLGNSKACFSYEELYNVTNGFSEKNLLGEGGFGCVYKGCLSDGREVAVKQLKVGGSQGEREFRAEVEIIGRVHHRHLVSLVGYCIADTQRLLVYDYVPNDTLHHHLHAGEGRPVMKWEVRVKVAAGAARGIAYLHEDCHPRIIHRDIKSSNILLDNEYEAQVSDFGLARLAMDAATHVTTRVMGTFGYMAPEYASSGKLTERSDVYSFGVVLLELITGRKPVDTSQPIGDESLVEWARPQLTHALETDEFASLIDPRLETNYNEKEMYRMIETAAACVRHSAPMRPRMGLVARALEGLGDIDLSNGVKPGQSELYSAQSAEIRLFQRMAFGNQNYSSDFSNFSNFSGKSQTD